VLGRILVRGALAQLPQFEENGKYFPPLERCKSLAVNKRFRSAAM
jgi:hypothetical protein